MSRHCQVCASPKPLHIDQLDLFCEPLGQSWVSQVDQLDRVQVVDPRKLVAAAEDRTLASVSLI